MNSEAMYSFIVYRKEMALKLGIFAVIGLLMLYLSNHVLENKFLSLFFLLVVIFPFFFINTVMKKFTRKVVINLKEGLFSIAIKKENEENERYSEVYLNEIKTYSISFPNYRFSLIKFNLKNGKTIEYSFSKKKQNDAQVGTDELIKSFQSLIQNYNRNIEDTGKILFQPSFFASKTGLVCIIVLSCLFVIVACLNLYIKSMPITLFFEFAIIMQLILKRKADVDYYKKMS